MSLTLTPDGHRCVFRYDNDWMAFNVFTENKDDHAKNFSFICRGGRWRLAPAYDLTPVPEGYNGEHATSVNGNGKPTVEDMLTVGETIRIPRKRGLEIIEFVKDQTSQLRESK